MNPEHRNKQMFRWSVVSTVLIALFWGVWYINYDSVPVLDTIPWNKTTGSILQLPIGVSRWLDIILGPAYSVLIVYIKYRTRRTPRTGRDDIASTLIIGFIFGLGIGFGGGIGVVLGVGLALGLGAALGVGLATGFTYALVIGLIFGVGVSLGVGLIFGLSAAIIVGFIFGFVIGIVSTIKKLLKSLHRWIATE